MFIKYQDFRIEANKLANMHVEIFPRFIRKKKEALPAGCIGNRRVKVCPTYFNRPEVTMLYFVFYFFA